MVWTGWAEAFVSPRFVAGYCASLVLVAGFLLVRFVWRARAVRRELNIVLKELLPLDSEEKFARAYSRVSSLVAELPALWHAWSEFDEQLIKPTLDPTVSRPAEPLIRSAHEAAQYFNAATIIDPKLNLRFYNSVPNYLTGFGILGTFAGLTAGITLAQSGMSPGNTAQSFAALQDLLSGAALAFWTSITGLLSATAFLITERNLIAGLQRRVAVLTTRLDRGLRLVTPAGLGIDQLRELEEQTATLKGFSTDLAIAIAKRVNEGMVTNLTPTLERVASAVEELAAGGRQTSDEVLQAVVKELGNVVAGAAGSEMSQMARTLEVLNGTMGSTVQSLTEVRSSLGGTMDEMSRSMQAAIESSGSAMEERLGQALEQMMTKLGSAAESVGGRLEEAGTASAAVMEESVQELKTAAERLVASYDSAERLRGAIDGTLADLDKAGSNMGRVAADFSAMLPEFSTMASNFRVTGERIHQAAEHIQSASEKSAGLLQDMRSHQEAVRAAWEEYRARFEDIDESLGSVVGQLNAAVVNYTDRMTKFVSDVDQHLSNAVTQLAGAVNELSDLVEALPGGGQTS